MLGSNQKPGQPLFVALFSVPRVLRAAASNGQEERRLSTEELLDRAQIVVQQARVLVAQSREICSACHQARRYTPAANFSVI